MLCAARYKENAAAIAATSQDAVVFKQSISSTRQLLPVKMASIEVT